MMNDNEIKELMKKARVHNRAGYDQIHALRFLITFKRSKDKFSEAEFRSIAAAKGVQLGGYKDMQALINQGRDIYRRLELITDRDLTEEIAPLPLFEEPELFPKEETCGLPRIDLPFTTAADTMAEICKAMQAINEKLVVIIRLLEARE